MIYTNEMVPTGRSLFILNLSAEASLTNGFRYVKELLMQRHNFYLNSSYKLLTNNVIDVYTVKTDAFTIRQSQLDSAKELLNWEEGIGNWRLNRTDDIKFPIDETLMALKENRLVQLHEHAAQRIELTIEYEYTTGKLCGYIEEHKRMMIKAEYGGCGKSYTCKSMETRGTRSSSYALRTSWRATTRSTAAPSTSSSALGWRRAPIWQSLRTAATTP